MDQEAAGCRTHPWPNNSGCDAPGIGHASRPVLSGLPTSFIQQISEHQEQGCEHEVEGYSTDEANVFVPMELTFLYIILVFIIA